MPRAPIFFVWRDAFELGLRAIDAEHRRCFELMTRCARAAKDGASPEVLDQALQELAACAALHFRSEEEALGQAGYPALEAQRAEHGRFEQALRRLRGLERTGVPVALALSRDWLLEHVVLSDRRYVAWLARDRYRRGAPAAW